MIQPLQPANVDGVMVDGRFLKRGGTLVGLDAAAIVEDARRAVQSLRTRAG